MSDVEDFLGVAVVGPSERERNLLQRSPKYRSWLSLIKKRFRDLTTVNVGSIVKFGESVGMFTVTGTNLVGVNSAAFVRGNSVAALLILVDTSGEMWFVFCEQTRFPVGLRMDRLTNGLIEVPAGMIDGSGEIKGKMIEEIKKEADVDITGADMFCLNPDGPIFLSPGGSDEGLTCYLVVKEGVDPRKLDEIREKTHGVASENEFIRLHLAKMDRHDSNEFFRRGIVPHGIMGLGMRDAKFHVCMNLFVQMVATTWIYDGRSFVMEFRKMVALGKDYE